jgi:hypothetical protein
MYVEVTKIFLAAKGLTFVFGVIVMAAIVIS